MLRPGYLEVSPVPDFHVHFHVGISEDPPGKMDGSCLVLKSKNAAATIVLEESFSFFSRGNTQKKRARSSFS